MISLSRSLLALALALPAVVACGGKNPPAPPITAPPPAASATLDEKALSVTLAREGATLRISVRDGAAPARTDLWLFTLENGALVPFTAWKDPDSRRKSRRLMLPATIGGQPSKLAPTGDGENGFMSDGVREKRVNGTAVPAIDGDVTVTLETVPTAPLVVVAAVEDQRYAGAAGIDASGAVVALPAGVGVPARHVARTFAKDIQPMLVGCLDCHAAGAEAADIKLATYDDVVNFDIKAGKEEVEYLVEPGAPALSPLARRTRPDEEKNASARGLEWFGKGGKRFGGHGDRRMPPQNTTEDVADDKGEAIYFDENPAAYQVLFDWIAQGAKP